MLKDWEWHRSKNGSPYVEGRVEEQSQGFADLRRRIDQLDAKLDVKIDRLDQKMSRQFFWLAGFQLTTLLAIIGFLGR